MRLLVLLALTTSLIAEPRHVTLKAPDGTDLKATYYAASKPGPAVMLFHMCNTTRESWAPLGPQLAAAGIHALAVDYRGYGESGGARADTLPGPERMQIINQKWPGDLDAAYAYLLGQPGVDKTRIGAAGGSCGVSQAIQFAKRHAEVRALALLAGPTNAGNLQFLVSTPWMPLFAAGADDDQYDTKIPQMMQWMLDLGGNPRNRMAHFKDGGHGTEIFGPHPELPKDIARFFTDTLITNVADPSKAVEAKSNPAREFWRLLHAPDGIEKAAALFKKTPVFVPEDVLNMAGYQHLQAKRHAEAIAVFKLYTEAHPKSANAWDSLGDAYLAAGQKDLALAASQKVLEMLPAYQANEAFKDGLKASAEEKIKKVKGQT